MKNTLKVNGLLIFIYTLLGFPLFYFVYKFGTPFLGMIDFYDYYKLYDTMDYKSADSPLNMRLVSSFFVYCMSRAGFFYDTACAIDGAPFSKIIYFNAIFFNFICVVLTCTMIYNLIKKQLNSVLMSFLGGVIYLLGFGTIFFELMPLTDAAAILIFTWILHNYYKKSQWIIVPLVLLILQREYVLLAMGVITLVDYVKFRDRYYMQILIYAIICFMIHVLLRKLIFETPRYSYHTSVDFLTHSLSKVNFPIIPFLRQIFMTLNVFLIYIFIVGYKFIKKISYDKHEFLKIILLFLQLLVLTFVLGLGNNAGRYFYILIPLIIIQIIAEVKIFQFETFKVKIS